MLRERSIKPHVEDADAIPPNVRLTRMRSRRPKDQVGTKNTKDAKMTKVCL